MKRERFSVEMVSENPALSVLKCSCSVLLLQGPVGPFFDRLSTWLISRSKQVHRIAFSGGDLHDCRTLNPIKYVGRPEHWSAYLQSACVDKKVDVIVLFGQSRFYHQKAIAVANRLNINVVVLEEGYFRPGFLTMELQGVNGNSTTLERFTCEKGMSPLLAATDKHPFYSSAFYAGFHYLCMAFQRSSFPA